MFENGKDDFIKSLEQILKHVSKQRSQVDEGLMLEQDYSDDLVQQLD